MSLQWIIVASVYFVLVSVCVFYYFGKKAPASQREFWTILITWIISLVFGPFILLALLFGAIRAVFKK